jgi:hypothetical protein
MAYDKVKYVHRKWRQVVIPLGIATSLALVYVLISLTLWLLGNSAYVRDDLFKFCLVVIGFSVPFYGFLRLIRSVVISRVS